MTKIDVPQGFQSFVWIFYPGFLEECGTLRQALPRALATLLVNEREELKSFLEFLLENDLNDETLKQCWDYADPTLNFELGGHRAFFKLTLDVLAEKYPDTR